MSDNLDNAGNQNDYAFGCAEGWGAYEVVRWHAVEEISSPYEFDIVLLRRADKGVADLDTLLDSAVSFRIATAARWRVIHGIVVEAEEIDRTTQFSLIRVLVMPAFVRARHRKRCRNFVDRTLAEIFATVLENRSPAYVSGNQGLGLLSGTPVAPPAEPSFDSFTPPQAQVRLCITDDTRIQDATLSPYVAQYNESDFDFLSRLLEKEGLSYYFEQTEDATVMTITDAPGQAPLFPSDERFSLRGESTGGSAARMQEAVRSMRDSRRLRSRAVTVREFDWHRSRTPFDAATQGSGDPDVLGVFEFLGEDENNTSNPGAFPSQIRAERLLAEQSFREGAGTVRSKEPGYKFTLTDESQLREDVDLLLVRIETYATALSPEGTVLDDEPFGFGGGPAPKHASHANRFLALPVSIAFRPAIRTHKPRIHGIHSAMVTAEEFGNSPPEINADKDGSVRVRFPWDQRANTGDGTPSSHWVRVSHAWAGAGFGGMSTPRVGQEVLISYLHGDPDRPVIIGRVYNPQTPPPYDASKQGIRSTMKSQSSPNATGFNELRMDDTAGSEEMFVNAQYDYNENVGNNQTTTVGNDQTTTVGNDQTTTVANDQTNNIGVDRTEQVGSNDSNTVGANRSAAVGANDNLAVAADQEIGIGANQSSSVGGNRLVTVGGTNGRNVGGAESIKIGGAQAVTVGAAATMNVTGPYSNTAAGPQSFKAPMFIATAATMFKVDTTTLTVTAGSAKLFMTSGLIVLDNGAGASVALVGPNVVTKAGGSISESGDGAINVATGGPFIATGTSVVVTGSGAVGIGSGGDVAVKGANIKLNS